MAASIDETLDIVLGFDDKSIGGEEGDGGSMICPSGEDGAGVGKLGEVCKTGWRVSGGEDQSFSSSSALPFLAPLLWLVFAIV